MHHPTDGIAHTTAFVTPVVEHWLEREIAQWVHHEGSIRWPIAPWANTLTTELYLAPLITETVFHIYHSTNRIAHTTAFVTPVMKHWLERENNSRCPPWGINPTTHNTRSGCCTTELHLILNVRTYTHTTQKQQQKLQWSLFNTV